MAISYAAYYKTINIKGVLTPLDRPLTMGILNLTPDSFFSGSRVQKLDSCLAVCDKMLNEGADIIDLGAQSTRPGSERIEASEEWKRLEETVTLLTKTFPKAAFSVDTFYSLVAEKAINLGVAIINDVSGGEIDPEMFACVSRLKVPYILSHIKGTPQDMSAYASYNDVAMEVVKKLSEKLQQLHELGCNDIIIDPGFGFAKNIQQNFELLANLKQLEILNKPILAGLSRKSMIWKSLDISADEALNGTTALNMAALERGANILRVHDVKEAKETIRLYQHLQTTV